MYLLCSSFCLSDSQLAVNIKGFVCADFQAADTLGAHLGIIDGRVEFVAPGAAETVAIAVVVAEQVIAAGLSATTDCEGLIYGSEQFFLMFGDQTADG